MALGAEEPTKAGCLQGVARELIALYKDPAVDVPAAEPLPIAIDEPGAQDQLVILLEDLLALPGTLRVVPVGIELCETEAGGIAGHLEVVPLHQVQCSRLPRTVRHGTARLRKQAGGWSASVLVEL